MEEERPGRVEQPYRLARPGPRQPLEITVGLQCVYSVYGVYTAYSVYTGLQLLQHEIFLQMAA